MWKYQQTDRGVARIIRRGIGKGQIRMRVGRAVPSKFNRDLGDIAPLSTKLTFFFENDPI